MKLWERIKNFFTEDKGENQEAKRPPLEALKADEKSLCPSLLRLPNKKISRKPHSLGDSASQ